MDEKDEPKDEPAAQQPAAPEPRAPSVPSALEAWRPGPAVPEPDDVGEVHASRT